ncbi:MAG: PKD domain-containing protein, partial [Candidatus Thermoplasmatota archaeon]|nr:PKD domain-containing protein [Candidatus Thermoplasmatota archaeon]
WKSSNSPGPDPWENHWPEHKWSLCVADFIGANQWKWDRNDDGIKDSNIDGSATYWWNNDGSKLYDYLPPASEGLPQTECGHGCKLFAESRGYAVKTVYNQLTDTPKGNPNGFTYSEFKAEINAGRPVITHWEGPSSSHTMLGVGYDSTTNTIYLYDTYDNYLHHCSWTGVYSDYGYKLKAVTVIHLADLPPDHSPSIPSNPNPSTYSTAIKVNSNLSWECSDPDGDWLTYEIYFGTVSSPPLVKSVEIIPNYNPGKMDYNTTYYWKIVAKDCRGQSTSGPIWNFTSCKNQNPNIPTVTGETNGKIGTLYKYTIKTTDPYQDKVKYHIDWGDKTTTFTGLNESGKQIIVSHIWNTKGTYTVTVKAVDEYGAESDWATLEVSMPKNKTIQYPQLRLLFEKLIQCFPFFEKILNLYFN